MNNRTYSNYLIVALFMFVVFGLSSCAPSGYERDEAGFFSGIWHGMIVGFSLIGKLFGADIGIYAEHNSGFTYWLGFILGISGLGRGASRTF